MLFHRNHLRGRRAAITITPSVTSTPDGTSLMLRGTF
jgi:hypothetical protein